MGPDSIQSKAEIIKYLGDSFAHADKILATVDEKTQLKRVDGPYGGPNTELGIIMLAIWHASDHYGQIVE